MAQKGVNNRCDKQLGTDFPTNDSDYTLGKSLLNRLWRFSDDEFIDSNGVSKVFTIWREDALRYI